MSDMPPAYFNPHQPHNCRRAAFHNYRSPSTYMITISKHPEAPTFSRIIGDYRCQSRADTAGTIAGSMATSRANPEFPDNCHGPARTAFLLPGEIINAQILDLPIDFSFFRILNHVVMPDHLHILWRANELLPRNLGYYVGLLKSRCTHLWHQASGSSSPLFRDKFNDCIAFTEDMCRHFSDYISDNPRRRLTAMRMQHLFRRVQLIDIAGHKFDFYGNFQLLRHPLISPVIFSRRYSSAELQRLKRQWDETIRSQGVLISPFIHPVEKEYMQRGIEDGASIIRLVADGLTPKYKPHGREFELCSEGRILHIGEHFESAQTGRGKREVFLFLNNVARNIAANPDITMRLIGINP